MKNVGVTEVKAENTINRSTSQAKPRQIERVVAGSRFGVNIVYNAVDIGQMLEDLTLLAKGMKLLQLDYLGGHGSRGNGRVSLENFRLAAPEVQLDPADTAEFNSALNTLQDIFRNEVEEYELFSAKTGI